MTSLSNEYEVIRRFWKELVKSTGFTDNRKRENVIIKHAFFTAARELTNLSLAQIGSFAGKDHATVLHASRNHESNMNYLPNYKTRYVHIKVTLAEQLEDAGYSNEVHCITNVKMLRERLMKTSKKLRKKINECNELEELIRVSDIGVTKTQFQVIKEHNQNLQERIHDLEGKLNRYANLDLI